MSKGASIPHLLRVHFANIGHPDSRLSPLTLDFHRGDEMGQRLPLNSVIWAENGVGKSSIRALLFSLLHPSIHDVMRSSNGPLDNRKYELFFGPRDAAFVVTEWLLPPTEQPNLAGFPEEPNTVVLGFTANWPGNVQSTLGDLNRHFFMFKPSGPVNFDRLPIKGLAMGTEPLNDSRAFMEWFRDNSKNTSGRHTTVHREWSNWLNEVGLDPMIFAYQLRMNGGQGGILGLFKNRINSPTDFVHFFLETVLQGDVAKDVVEVLNEKKRHIEKQPQWEAEVTFVDEALPLLANLQRDKAAYEEIKKSLDEDRKRGGALVSGLGEAHEILTARLEDTLERQETTDQLLTERQNKHVHLQEYRAWLRYRECQLAYEDAENRLEESRTLHQQALTTCSLLKAAIEFRSWREKQDECRAIDAELQSRKDSNQDIEKELRDSGTALVQVLDREIKKTDVEVNDAKNNLANAKRTLTNRQKDFNRVKADLSKLREVIRGINNQLQTREKVLLRLVNGGILESREQPADAMVRWEGEYGAAVSIIVGSRDTFQKLDDDKRILSKQLQERVIELTRWKTELDQLKRTLMADEQRKQNLENDSDLRLLTEEDKAHLADPDLLGLINEHVARKRAETFRLNRIVADQKETLEALEQSDSRLYPPPPEVAKLLRVLREDLGIPAHLATEELDKTYPDDPQEAERLFTRDPARYMGIMVHTEEALQKIRESMDKLQRPAFPVQISFSGGEPADPPVDALVLNPGHQAAFNRNAATEMVAPMRLDIAEKERRFAQLHKDIERLNAVHDSLSQFLTDYPSGTLRELLERIDAKQMKITELEALQDADKEKLEQSEDAFLEIKEKLNRAQHTKQQSENTISRIRDFMEDHESHFEEFQMELAQNRSRLHELEDESMRLEALLEEDQVLVTERQEMVFNRKALWERRKDEQRAVGYAGGELADISNLNLAEAETRYKLLLDRFRKVSEKDETLRARLEEKQNAANQQETRFRKELGEHDEYDVVQILKDGAVEDRLSEAEVAERNAARAFGAGENALDAARDRLRQAPTIQLDYRPPMGEAQPETIEEARVKREELVERLERGTESIEKLKETAARLTEESRLLKEDLTLRKLKRDEILSHVTDFVESEPAHLPMDNEALGVMLDSFWNRYRDHRSRHSNAKINLDHRCDKLRDLAVDPRFQDFPNDKREILKVRESLMRLTDDIIREFEIFRDVIRGSIRMSEESMEAVITRLDAAVGDALYLLNQAKTGSRLPESMEGWGGRAFLKMEILNKISDRLEDRKPVYERVLRDVLKLGKPIYGLELVKRSIDGLAGERGYKVVIMKPGYALKTDYYPITDVKGWSDGEKITSVILLYCTMVQLRAAATGARTSADKDRSLSNGMLFLDNPFGEANSLTFVNMQLTMARALNIQLVYTASGSHKHLMARFPRVIRLSQEQGKQTNKTFVKATDVGNEVRADVHVTAAHFGKKRAG